MVTRADIWASWGLERVPFLKFRMKTVVFITDMNSTGGKYLTFTYNSFFIYYFAIDGSFKSCHNRCQNVVRCLC